MTSQITEEYLKELEERLGSPLRCFLFRDTIKEYRLAIRKLIAEIRRLRYSIKASEGGRYD